MSEPDHAVPSRRERLWRIIFRSDTPEGRRFDVALLWLIALSVLTLTLESVATWIARYQDERTRGEGLLVLTQAPEGQVMGYSKITVWPGRASAELAGALRAGLQGSGAGGAGATHTIGWIFRELKVSLV